MTKKRLFDIPIFVISIILAILLLLDFFYYINLKSLGLIFMGYWPIAFLLSSVSYLYKKNNFILYSLITNGLMIILVWLTFGT